MARTHHVEPTADAVHGAVGSARSPLLEIDPGDTVVLRTVDVAFGVEPPTDTVSPRTKVLPADAAWADGPGKVGPIAVRGAEPGMVLAVHIVDIETAPAGYTFHGGGFPMGLAEALGVERAELGLVRWQLDRASGRAVSDNGFGVAMRPFPGTIGLAPAEPGPVPGWPPMATGGNLDCRELVVGSTLHLPVAAAGGLLSVGDGHAAQGDGEVAGMAIECCFRRIELRVDLQKGPAPERLWAETPTGVVTFGFDESLDVAMLQAVNDALAHLERRFDVTRGEALVLASAALDVRVTQVVNGVRGVHAVLANDAITRVGADRQSTS